MKKIAEGKVSTCRFKVPLLCCKELGFIVLESGKVGISLDNIF